MGAKAVAREEHDREDLLAEAVALVWRIEWDVPGEPAPVVVGFRAEGGGSVYFGPEPAYHFNPRGELRRAIANDRLYKAEAGRLVELERRRMPDVVELWRHELDAAATTAFVETARARLAALAASIESGAARPLRQVPADAEVGPRAASWLAAQSAGFAVARSPGAAG